MSWQERWIPTQEKLEKSRWLGWLAPWLGRPSLWQWSRHGVALGVAIGIFFGLLVPIAQIPASAIAAIVLRANLPAAAASTMVSNPVTFAPVYYLAYELGSTVLGTSGPVPALPRAATATPASGGASQMSLGNWEKIKSMGMPLMVGLLILAVAGGLGSYLIISLVWWVHQYWTARAGRRTGPPGKS